MAGLKEQPTSSKSRVEDIRAQINRLTAKGVPPDKPRQTELRRLSGEMEVNLREFIKQSRAANDVDELRVALAELCSLVAEQDPDFTLELIKEFHNLPPTADLDLLASISDSLHLAYKKHGDGVRAEQHRAIAFRLRKELADQSGTGDAVTWQGLTAALRSSATPLAKTERWALELTEPLDSWLSTKREIGLNDLAPAFGQFVTNDRKFYRDAKDRLEILIKRLRANLSKPDNYLLLAEPGSGKSFFVEEFTSELKAGLGSDVVFLQRNLSVYENVELAFIDIISDVLFALCSHKPVLLFIDEVDTALGDRNIFQRLIAPMNGDSFVFLGKQISFAKQNLVVFFALSSKAEAMEGRQKWPDFLSRIPIAHRIHLPEFKSHLDRIYRAVAILPRGQFSVAKVQASALLYIGLRNWTSVREMEQALELSKIRAAKSKSTVLELAHVAVSPEDVEEVQRDAKASFGGIDIFASSMNPISIVVS